MFHSWRMEHRINRIHERALRLIYPSDSKLTFKELLDKNKTVSILKNNLQVLATETYQAKLIISPEMLKELFSFNVRNYNLGSQSILKRIKTNSVYFGSEGLSSLAPKIWDLPPDSFKNGNSLVRFKNRIKTWTTDICPCRTCKVYIGQVRFICLSSSDAIYRFIILTFLF